MPEFDIYPNPAQGSISLSLTNSNTSVNTTEQTKYAIYNSLGQIVFEKNLGSIPSITETINISNLKTGVYIIRILSGSISINKFLLKTKKVKSIFKMLVQFFNTIVRSKLISKQIVSMLLLCFCVALNSCKEDVQTKPEKKEEL